MTVYDLFRPWWTLRKKNATITGTSTISLSERLPYIAGEQLYVVSESQMSGMRWAILMSWSVAIAVFITFLMYVTSLVTIHCNA